MKEFGQLDEKANAVVEAFTSKEKPRIDRMKEIIRKRVENLETDEDLWIVEALCYHMRNLESKSINRRDQLKLGLVSVQMYLDKDRDQNLADYKISQLPAEAV